MSSGAVPLDPVIHAQARLRIMATLAGLPRGDEMVFPRLREMLGMTAGEPVHPPEQAGGGRVRVPVQDLHGTHPRHLPRAHHQGRAAFEEYTRALQAMLAAAGQ